MYDDWLDKKGATEIWDRCRAWADDLDRSKLGDAVVPLGNLFAIKVWSYTLSHYIEKPTLTPLLCMLANAADVPEVKFEYFDDELIAELKYWTRDDHVDHFCDSYRLAAIERRVTQLNFVASFPDMRGRVDAALPYLKAGMDDFALIRKYIIDGIDPALAFSLNGQ